MENKTGVRQKSLMTCAGAFHVKAGFQKLTGHWLKT
jgi:hypothetical protein